MFGAFVLAAGLGAWPFAVASVPGRCNGQVADALADRAERLIAQRGREPDAQIAAGERLLGDIRGEAEIDAAVCPSEAALVPIARQLHAAAALAYLAQADAALAKFAVACPLARDRIAAAFMAGAWLEVAQGVPATGEVPQLLAPIVPLIRARAAQVKLALPAFADTSNYWKTTVQAQGRTALARCHK